MTAAHYALKSIEFYARELRFLFKYYPEVLPADIVDTHITQYMCYVKDVLQCGRGQMPWHSTGFQLCMEACY